MSKSSPNPRFPIEERGRMPRAEVAAIRKAQKGDRKAMAFLLETHQRQILGTLYRLLGPRYSEELEDFAQDLFLRICKALTRFDFDRRARFSTWIYTFTKNYCFDVLKKRRLDVVSISALSGRERGDFDLPATAEGPIESIDRRELASYLAHAVDQLPEEQRVVFVLREYEELNYPEIAVILDLSEGTVKSRLYRAKETLRVRLSPYLREGHTTGFDAQSLDAWTQAEADDTTHPPVRSAEAKETNRRAVDESDLLFGWSLGEVLAS